MRDRLPTSSIVSLPGPLDVPASLEPFRRWGDDLIDRWDGTRLLRTSRVGTGVIAWRAEVTGTAGESGLAVVAEHGALPEALAAAIRESFVPVPPGWSAFLGRDRVIAALDRRHPGLRPVLVPDLFTALVRSISAQQVNLRWAATTRRRLAETLGDRHVVAGEEVMALRSDRVAEASVEQVRALQFTTAKARSIVDVAHAFSDGRIDPIALHRASDADVIATLTDLRGIGPWSAEWILARTFGRPVVVAGDLGVRKAVGRIYLGVPIASEAEVRRATEHWGDAATVAQTLVLRTLLHPA